MLHNNPTRQSKTCASLEVGQCPWAGGSSRQAQGLHKPILDPGRRVQASTVLFGENLCPSCFEQRKKHFTAARLILRIQISWPLDLRITEICVTYFSSVWPVCQGKPHLLLQLLVMWQEPTCEFSAEQLSFSKTGWSSAAGLEPGPAAGAVNGMIEAFNLTPFQQSADECWSCQMSLSHHYPSKQSMQQ